MRIRIGIPDELDCDDDDGVVVEDDEGGGTSRFVVSELQLLEATEMNIFCGNLVSLYECIWIIVEKLKSQDSIIPLQSAWMANSAIRGVHMVISGYNCEPPKATASTYHDQFYCSFVHLGTKSMQKPILMHSMNLDKGKEKVLVDKDIPKLRQVDRMETCYFVLKEKLSKEKEKGTLNHSVLKTVFLWQLKAILISGFFALIKALTLATGPLFLRAFILVAEGKETFKYEGYALTAGL
ncbi:hypothetical protein RHSIM_Rhsim01G0093100 [Rhododendron simsii]|uniref:Uncharacterized protein n=1 Tax=Rhododendron simsii TaxID=118357 RepID=A0A834HM46_RHOSS|nr:hypothetical protein RHSIM_Rhsim01G0093100 [Rhododendron simsii]